MDSAGDIPVLCCDLNRFLLFGNGDGIQGFVEYKGRSRFQFPHDPVAVRHVEKAKHTDLVGFRCQQGGFFGEGGFLRPEQPEQGAADAEAVLIDLFAQDAAADEVVFNGRAVVDRDMDHRHILPGIFEYHGIFLITDLVMLVGAVLLHIQTGARRYVGGKGRFSGSIAGNDLQKAVRRNDAAVRCRQIFSGI